ncbi:DUF3262 family protein [Mannheimia haemolytica]|uniref:Integrating conjugative element protein, PFL_4701 family n=2 Tax=Mannheimia haemolytica TaxID=75985 RepID=A0A378N6T8_MANHA|nr:DUF3262 family protein [Mannheimia haemolytica]ASW16647.1 DUF3262 domain-containing protein [Mannheimia haemolytica USDA-ARS-USMARC-183]ASW16710.1 DUF3262 domain-containing protein [Mannheimia haemolytica USDA-ARS-USMARC-185]ASW68435.1 DUF3262 domain-containing protein [Mannheimia haemolytica]AWW66776.1 TIGR03758 family integrating conjugative element protein [Mannheimia haemolytica]KYL07738.1 hypothetical protein AC567_09380 [Mannheimia haemolytica]
MMSYSPVDAFSAASGIDPFRLKLMIAIIFLSMLLLAVAWALNSGYKGFSFRDKSPFSLLVLFLKGVALLVCVTYFFIY